MVGNEINGMVWPKLCENYLKWLGIKILKKSPTSFKSCPHDLGPFYHGTHYVNGKSQGLLCQRAAAAFRGSVQVHQVLMSQRRNQQRHRTPFTSSTSYTLLPTIQLYAAARYTAAVSCLDLKHLALFLGKGFHSRLNTATIAHNAKQDYHSNASWLGCADWR